MGSFFLFSVSARLRVLWRAPCIAVSSPPFPVPRVRAERRSGGDDEATSSISIARSQVEGGSGDAGRVAAQRARTDRSSKGMALVLRKRKRDRVGEDCDVPQHADEEPSDEELRASQNSDGYWQRSTASYLNSLGDEQLFDVIKKFTCNAVRQFISSDFSSWAAPGNVPPCPAPATTGVSNGSSQPSSPAGQRTCSRLSVIHFQQVLDALHPEQRLVIIKYGFGCLLLFDRCLIPLGFARWLADHVNVETSEIVLKNMSIKISPQSVSDVLGLPIGGKEISRDPRAKDDFLSATGANTLPFVKSFSDQLLNGDISDDEVVRNFLAMALVTFLCPHS
ncbi:hypothetical protein BS78_K102500 [Paspalum vaginatum]|uniref:Uncharacterized protein n=1 Tax=Paspalum vaginatum TaxID=158149 RepID=A0A9W7XE67_9POAL|nr:hypothetical protein BS78_K102500 [Paspalum vaginatum]